MYAIIETGGKQYKVAPGQTVDVEKLSAETGSTLELDRVLLLADGDNITVGHPTVDGARVVANVVETAKGAKVVVFKYKAKVRYRNKRGHRQPYTRLAITRIVPGAATGGALGSSKGSSEVISNGT